MKNLLVSHKFNEKKLISFLEFEFPNASRNIFFKALRKKDIRVNNKRVSENVIIYENDEIKIYISDEYLYPENEDLNIEYEDENILVINKAKGIEVVGDNSLTSILQKNFQNKNIMPCHRLDRNTDGLVLFAKSKKALDILVEKFSSREITKFYKCTVYGIFQKKCNILKAYLFKDAKKSLVYISDEKKKGYREIITEYRVLEEDSIQNISFLEVILHTGRTHQIRAHLSHIGHPIIGDR